MQRYVFYGSRGSAQDVERLMEHLFARNDAAERAGRPKTPLCVWGTHGIGKTSVVERFAASRGMQLTYVAPAQFEEMGDLLGMPELCLAPDGSKRTTLRPPDWAPIDAGPGILLLDDANRADIRILRGIMQLLQRFELTSWKLPPRWQIVLTANPDGGDYAVTTLDDAMLTRMMHVTMEFDVGAWASWAEASGLDPRGINFVLAYPELVSGQRTTARSLTQFCEMIAPIVDLEAELGLVRLLADGCLDGATAAAFQGFVEQRLSKLMSVEEILRAGDFEREVEERLRPLLEGRERRIDILAVLSTRLVNSLRHARVELDETGVRNLGRFIQLDCLPGDLRLTLAQELVALGGRARLLMAQPPIARLLAERL